MKIIHTADLHIGGPLQGLPKHKADLRKAELLDGVKKLCDYARATDVSAVIIAGDLFDIKSVETRLKKEIFSLFASAPQTNFYCIFGNHDGETDIAEFQPNNFFTFSKAHGFFSYDLGENVTLTGCDRGYFSPDFPLLDKNAFNIVTLHGELGKDIPLESVREKHIDYLALGHIHKPMPAKEKLDSRGYYRYSGCLEGRGFDETGARGFFLLEMEKGRIKEEKFLSFSTRKIERVEVDITGCESYYDIERKALDALAFLSGSDMVKLVLCGTFTPTLKKDLALLTSRLLEKFFFVKVEDQSKLYVDYRAYETDKTERGEFVREVGRYEMDEDLRAEILEVGLKALGGEEIDL